MNDLRDTLQRPLRELRISVTDHCNFRCVYCMPKAVFGRGYGFLPKTEVLSLEEIARLARVFASLGVEKVRLTGGEPTLRNGLDELIGMLTRIDGLREVTLTTNGSRLEQQARTLRQAGLTRLNVSLDSLDDDTFRAMNDVDFPVEGVLRGIDAAVAAGFAPIKINMVVKRGLNDDSIAPMAWRFCGPEFVLRFIEFMDVGNANGWRMSEVVPASEIIERVSAELPLTPLPRQHASETALRYRVAGGGEIGVVASVTKPFCQHCARARLTADGRLFTCLFATCGHDLRGPLRDGASDAELAAIIARVWGARSDRYSETRTRQTSQLPKVEMSMVGG